MTNLTTLPDRAQIHTAICHLKGLLGNGGNTVHGPWLADTIALLSNFESILAAQNNVIDGLKCEIQQARAEALEDAAQIAESQFPQPTLGIHGFQEDMHVAGLRIADTIRAMKGGA